MLWKLQIAICFHLINQCEPIPHKELNAMRFETQAECVRVGQEITTHLLKEYQRQGHFLVKSVAGMCDIYETAIV